MLNSASCRLLLFLRYPRAGNTKTRLIPALGAEGAAQLQQEMAEHLLRQIDRPDWQLEVHFTGGSQREMQDWLGLHLRYQQQQSGDLGARLWAGFQNGFVKNTRTVAIGSDCPELTPQHIQSAFHQLAHNDLVLGPATDGGYYLIGLSSLQPSLFQNIDWSTSIVLQQTLAKAEQLGLSTAQLTTLSDIDRPEDLAIWERVQQKHRPKTLSTIPKRCR